VKGRDHGFVGIFKFCSMQYQHLCGLYLKGIRVRCIWFVWFCWWEASTSCLFTSRCSLHIAYLSMCISIFVIDIHVNFLPLLSPSIKEHPLFPVPFLFFSLLHQGMVYRHCWANHIFFMPLLMSTKQQPLHNVFYHQQQETPSYFNFPSSSVSSTSWCLESCPPCLYSYINVCSIIGSFLCNPL
jgi:hypothetical protein